MGDANFGFASSVVMVGLSAIQGITTTSGLISIILKYGSGGSLEFGGTGLSWGNGYLMSQNEALSFDVRGNFYLCATGSTVTAYLTKGLSEGISGLS